MAPTQKINRHKQLLRILSADSFWILLISAIVRLIYYSTLLTTKQTDTASYLNYHANILKGQTEALRTPVYPYFIKLAGLFSSPQNLLNNVVIAQVIISFLSIFLFYKIARTLFKYRA